VINAGFFGLACVSECGEMMLLRVWLQISTVPLALLTLTCLGRLIDGFIHRPSLLRVRQISRHFKIPALWQSGKGL
jgi:hypothetical protein